MTAPVLSIATVRDAKLAAIAHHPSVRGRVPEPLLPAGRRAELLTMLASTWEPLADFLSVAGRDRDEVEQVLTDLGAAMVHPAARGAFGPFLRDELLRVVQHRQDLQDGEISHKDLDGPASYEDALADADEAIDLALYPLLTGHLAREACRGCRRTRTVHNWATQVECTDHAERRLS